MKLDLNCDLGEGEPLAKTRALMRSITSANVACGGHAGSIQTMGACVRLAKQFKVRVGAHPGVGSNFGRGEVAITPSELQVLVLQQASALARICAVHRVELHHIKLHGSLYHATESNDLLARAFLLAVRQWFPKAIVYVRADGRVARLARKAKVPVWEEAFADRAYRRDGSLVPRSEAGAVISNAEEIARRIDVLNKKGIVESIDGARVQMAPKTLCVHSDTPNSTKVAALCRRLIR